MKLRYNRIITLFLFLIAVVSNAQTQQGIVKTRGRLSANGQLIAGIKLSGATITVKNGGDFVSGSDGTFSLSVPSKTFSLSNVQKQGYQLCDRDLLGKNYQYSNNPVIVVMETPDNTTADRLAAEKKIRRTLQRQLQDKEDEIEALKEQQKISEEQYRKQLQELYAAQENNEKLISEMAIRYSTLDFDQMDEFQRQVASYIQNGELTRADSLLNTKGSMEERSAELNRMDAAIKADAEELSKRQDSHDKSVAMKAKLLEEFAADCYSRFEICNLRHEVDSAIYWLQMRVNKDSTNVDWVFSLCQYYGEIHDYPKALIYAKKSIELYKDDKDIENIIDVSNIMSTCYSLLGQTEQAVETLQKTLLLARGEQVITPSLELKIYTKMASFYNYVNNNEDTYYALSKCDSIFGERHSELGTIEMGLYYKEAVSFQKQIENYPEVIALGFKAIDFYLKSNQYVSAIDMMLMLVNSYEEMGEYQHAQEMIENAELFCANNHIDSYLSIIYETKGGLYFRMNQPEESRMNYQKAIEIYSQEKEKGIEQLAHCYIMIANAAESDQEALDYLHHGLNLYRIIYNESSQMEAYAYVSIGRIYENQKDFKTAIAAYEIGASIMMKAVGENNSLIGDFFSNIAMAYLPLDTIKAVEFIQGAINKIILNDGLPTDNVIYAWDRLIEHLDEDYKRLFFREFIPVMEVVTENSPSYERGMRGKYYILEYNNWSISAKNSFYETFELGRDKKKRMVLYQDNSIQEYVFDIKIGAIIKVTWTPREEIENIKNKYMKWKQNKKR